MIGKDHRDLIQAMAPPDRVFRSVPQMPYSQPTPSSEPFGILTTFGHLGASARPSQPHRGILGFMLPPDAVGEGNSRGLTRIDSHVAESLRGPTSMSEVSHAEIMSLPPYERWLVTLSDDSPELFGQPDPRVGPAPSNQPHHLMVGSGAAEDRSAGSPSIRDIFEQNYRPPMASVANMLSEEGDERDVISGQRAWESLPRYSACPTVRRATPQEPFLDRSERFPWDPLVYQDAEHNLPTHVLARASFVDGPEDQRRSLAVQSWYEGDTRTPQERYSELFVTRDNELAYRGKDGKFYRVQADLFRNVDPTSVDLWGRLLGQAAGWAGPAATIGMELGADAVATALGGPAAALVAAPFIGAGAKVAAAEIAGGQNEPFGLKRMGKGALTGKLLADGKYILEHAGPYLLRKLIP